MSFYLEPLSAEFLASLKEPTRFTPDISQIETKERALVFVYNELQQIFTMRLNDLDGRFMGTCFSIERWTLFKQYMGPDNDPRAIVVENKWPRIEQERIKGEVWSFDHEGLKELDSYMLNTVEFQRRRENFIYPHRYIFRDPEGAQRSGPWRHDIVNAWIYMGITDYWNEHIDAGYFYRPCRIFQIKRHEGMSYDNQWSEILLTDRYYAYSMLELNDTNNREAHTVS